MPTPVSVSRNGLGIPVTIVGGGVLPDGGLVLLPAGQDVPSGWSSTGEVTLGDQTYQLITQGGGAAPAVITAPSVNPNPVTVGDNLTFTQGTYSNSTNVTRRLMQGTADVTSQIVDDVWSPGNDDDAVYTETPVGPGGNGPVQTINITVNSLSPGLTPADYYSFVDPTDVPGADGTSVTSVVSRGTGGITYTASSSGAAPVKETSAVRFTSGQQYLMADAITVPAADGFILVADFTPNQATGTQNVLGIYAPSGVVLGLIRSANTQLQYNVGAGINGTSTNLASGTLAVGTRVQMAIEFDRVAATVRYWNLATGAVVSQPLTYSGPINAVRISVGQSSNHSIHKWAVVNRAAGQPWTTTFEEVLADFSLGGGDIPGPTPEPGTLTAMRGYTVVGQSLELGPNIGATNAPSGGRWRDVLVNPRVRMLTGHRRKDGVAITQVGTPLLGGYDTTVNASGDTQAIALSSVPPGFITALDLVEDLPNTVGIAYQFHSAGGQSIVNLDDDPAEGDTIIPWENFSFWTGQAADLYEGRDLPLEFHGFGINQGEADVARPLGWWLTRAANLVSDSNARIRQATGQNFDPRLYLNQTGGYMLKTGSNQAFVVLDQVELVRQTPGAVLAVVNYALPIDNSDGRGVHMGVVGNAMMGHLRAWAIQESEAGRAWNLMPPVTATRTGDEITIPITVRSDETLTAVTGKYATYGGDPANLGLEAVGGGSIVNASVSGGNIVLQVSGTVASIRYAFQMDGVDYKQFTVDNIGYATHRGLIRTTLTKQVSALGGLNLTLERWVPSFEVAITSGVPDASPTLTGGSLEVQ